MKTVSMTGDELIHTMQHEDPIDRILRQAFAVSDPLTESQDIPVLEDSSAIELELSQWQELVHSLTYDAPPLPMAHLQERLAIEIGAINQDQPTPNLPLSKTISTWQQQAATATWEPYVEGITTSCIDLDLTARQIYCFVRLEPGATFPRHRHAAPEELLMLEGDLIIDGQTYYPGDYIYSQPGSIHQPSSRDGCLVIVRASIDDQIIDDQIFV